MITYISFGKQGRQRIRGLT